MFFIRLVAVLWVAMCSIALGEAPATRPTTSPATAPTTRPARFGLSVLDANLVERNGPLLALGGNLIVQGTAWNSRAEKLGIDIADVVKRVDGKEVTSVAELNAQLGKRGPHTIEIIRDGKTIELRETADEGAKSTTGPAVDE